jgi:hypothetical protein
VDFSQRYASSGMGGSGDTEQVVKAARRNSPRSVQNDPVKSKRLDDSVRESMAAYDTTPEEDALLRQARPEQSDDDHESIIRMLKQFHPHGFWNVGSKRVPAYQHIWGDPESEKRLRAVLADGTGTANQQSQEPPKSQLQLDNEFWNNPEEMKKYTTRKL